MFNQFSHLTDGLRVVSLREAAKVAEKYADHIRIGQQTLVDTGQLEQPRLDYLREADALEKLSVVARILSLDEDAARKFMEDLKVLRA